MIACVLMLLGCRGAQYVGSTAAPGGTGEGLFEPHRLSRNQKFEGATSSLRERVQLFGAAAGTVDDASARRAVGSMADAIANVPDSQGVDVAAAARTMRTDYVDVIGATGGPASAHLRRVLMVAAGAMTLLAHGPYVLEPAVARRVAAFQQAAAEVNPDDAIEAQPRAVVRALAGAGAALASIERASGSGPAAVVPAPSPSSSNAAPGQSAGVTQQQQPSTVPYLAPFASALLRYSDAVDSLAVTPSSKVAVALRRTLDALADVLQVLPAGATTSDSEGIALMRSFASDMAAAPTHSGAQAGFTKQALDQAEAILSLAATRSFGRMPAVGNEVREMDGQIRSIDAEQPLAPQVLRVLEALEGAEDALRTMAAEPPR